VGKAHKLALRHLVLKRLLSDEIYVWGPTGGDFGRGAANPSLGDTQADRSLNNPCKARSGAQGLRLQVQRGLPAGLFENEGVDLP